MTTEAEDFEKEINRANSLIILFSRIWGTHKAVDWDTYTYKEKWRSSLSYWDFRFFGTEQSYDTELLAIRALNDRLELALQGKVKGE